MGETWHWGGPLRLPWWKQEWGDFYSIERYTFQSYLHRETRTDRTRWAPTGHKCSYRLALNWTIIIFPLTLLIEPLFNGWVTSWGGGFVEHSDYRSDQKRFRDSYRRHYAQNSRREIAAMPGFVSPWDRYGPRYGCGFSRGADQSIGAAGWCGFRHGPMVHGLLVKKLGGRLDWFQNKVSCKQHFWLFGLFRG